MTDPIIDESMYGKGYIPRDYDADPLGQIVGIPRFSVPLIPKEEWKERIAEKTANQSWLKDVMLRAGMQPKNQGSFGWCHAAALVQAAQIAYLSAGFPLMEFSIASVAGPVTGWRDAGAVIRDDINYAAEFGIAETSVFPDLPSRNDPYCGKGLFTDEVRANALKHRVQAEDLNVHEQAELITCCLTNITTGVGIRDWSHSTTGPMKLHWVPRSSDPLYNVDLEMLNNWGLWSADQRCKADNGFYIVPYNGYHQPYEAYAIYSVM